MRTEFLNILPVNLHFIPDTGKNRTESLGDYMTSLSKRKPGFRIFFVSIKLLLRKKKERSENKRHGLPLFFCDFQPIFADITNAFHT